MTSIKEKYNKIVKVIISTGTGSVKDEPQKQSIEKSLTLIAGQKPKVNQAKKAIASFKSRKGLPIGYSVTLRGQRMIDFLEKLINVTIPRMRDFRGLNPSFIDRAGNMTIGFKEHIVFPEAAGEDVRSAFGVGVTVVTSAPTKEEASELLKLIGFPFKK